MISRPEVSDEVRKEAFAYVDAVLARARGGAQSSGTAASSAPPQNALASRLIPGFLKRAVVRTLIYVMRHPFDHLAHPVVVRLEEEIGQARGIAQAALTRAEQMGAELRRVRTELDRERRGR